jgi:hypothetical protein
MARPRKAPEEKRDDQLNPRLTTAERAEIERNAAALGIAPTEFMRRRTLGYRLPMARLSSQSVCESAVPMMSPSAFSLNFRGWTPRPAQARPPRCC